MELVSSSATNPLLVWITPPNMSPPLNPTRLGVLGNSGVSNKISKPLARMAVSLTIILHTALAMWYVTCHIKSDR
jgi:hypothetical protein